MNGTTTRLSVFAKLVKCLVRMEHGHPFLKKYASLTPLRRVEASRPYDVNREILGSLSEHGCRCCFLGAPEGIIIQIAIVLQVAVK